MYKLYDKYLVPQHLDQVKHKIKKNHDSVINHNKKCYLTHRRYLKEKCNTVTINR